MLGCQTLIYATIGFLTVQTHFGFARRNLEPEVYSVAE